MNLYKLRAVVRERCGVRILAERLGWHRKRVQELLRGRFEPDRAEIVKISKALHIRGYEFAELFFPELIDREGCWDA